MHGRSGFTPVGIAPLRYSEIDAWVRLTGVRPSARDVRALLILDGILSHPGPPETTGEVEDGGEDDDD